MTAAARAFWRDGSFKRAGLSFGFCCAEDVGRKRRAAADRRSRFPARSKCALIAHADVQGRPVSTDLYAAALTPQARTLRRCGNRALTEREGSLPGLLGLKTSGLVSGCVRDTADFVAEKKEAAASPTSPFSS